jgi:hypothetical protein
MQHEFLDFMTGKSAKSNKSVRKEWTRVHMPSAWEHASELSEKSETCFERGWLGQWPVSARMFAVND